MVVVENNGEFGELAKALPVNVLQICKFDLTWSQLIYCFVHMNTAF